MCLTYIETYHRLCAKSLIVNYSLVEFFFSGKNILLFLGLFVLIFYSGKGGGYFLCSNKALDSSSIYLLIFFLPFALKEALTKLIMKMSGGSRGALCIIYLNLFSLLSCN